MKDLNIFILEILFIEVNLIYIWSYNFEIIDIKGSNILVDNNGICKLADFGTAKKISSLFDNCMAYSLRGTIYWMAPEVMKQKAVGRYICIFNNLANKFLIQRYSDIWSLGCTVLEMATGKHPWSTSFKGTDQVNEIIDFEN